MNSPYKRDSSKDMHRGAIYEFRPIFWIESPLLLLRGVKFSSPRQIRNIYEVREVNDAFQQPDKKNEEYVLATAKVRFVIVLSENRIAKRPGFKSVLIVPLYTLKESQIDRQKLEIIRNNDQDFLYYLPYDSAFPILKESVANIFQIQFISKKFMVDGKQEFALTDDSTAGIIQKFKAMLFLKSSEGLEL